MTERDEILEAAALEIEEPEFMDLRGALSPTKKGQREYEIRSAAIDETRKSCARVIRAMKSGNGLDPMEQLRRIAAISPDSRQHELYLKSAWPLAFKGWLNIECRIRCNSNSVPPETEYRIELTDKGRAALSSTD